MTWPHHQMQIAPAHRSSRPRLMLLIPVLLLIPLVAIATLLPGWSDSKALAEEGLSAAEIARDVEDGPDMVHESVEHEHTEHLDVIQVVAGVVNFILLVFILRLLLRRPLIGFLKSRRAQVERELEESKRIQGASETLLAETERRVADIDREAEQIRQDVLAAGRAERDRLVQDAEDKASRMRREATSQANQEVKQLQVALRQELTQDAVDRAKTIVRREISAEDQTRLNDTFLQELLRQAKQHDVQAGGRLQPAGRL